jgi:hypothetical protein
MIDIPVDDRPSLAFGRPKLPGNMAALPSGTIIAVTRVVAKRSLNDSILLVGFARC